MARDIIDASPIESRDALVAWLEQGCKPADSFRVGTEHEKIPFYRADRAPVPYGGEEGICALLEGLGEKLGWEPIVDDGRLIGLYDSGGGGAISLEPGGQFELSGAPVATIHETAVELDRHLADAAKVGGGFGIGFLALGLSPKWSLRETPAMPKSRYQIMNDLVAALGHGRGFAQAPFGAEAEREKADAEAAADFGRVGEMAVELHGRLMDR